MELLAWGLRRPNAVSWGLKYTGPPDFSFYDLYHSAICVDRRVVKGIKFMSSRYRGRREKREREEREREEREREESVAREER
jgi:hypothetical protein